MQQQPPIGFLLRGIRTEQFAVLPELYKENETIGLNMEVRYGTNKEENLIVVFVKCNFIQNEKPILIVEVSHHYTIEPNSFADLVNENNRSITIPVDLATHLVMLTLGTVRGLVHGRVENTALNRLFIPIVNLTPFVQQAIVLNY